MKTKVILALVVVVVAVLATLGVLFWKSKNRSEIGVPYRIPSESDSALAALINVLDADMRSIEIGSWFISRLRAQLLAKTNPIQCDTFIDLGNIATAVPGANDVTKAEIIIKLRRLVAALFKGCSGTTTKELLVNTLDAFEDSAFKPGSGLLLRMPGYSLKSSKPLPK